MQNNLTGMRSEEFYDQTTGIRRVKKIFISIVVIMSILVCRLWYIQLYCHETFEAAALSQYKVQVQGLDTRGVIFDRNIKPLTGGTTQYYYVIKKTYRDSGLDNLIKTIEAEQVAKSSSRYYVYRAEIFDEDVTETLKERYGAYVFENRSRYSNRQLACHIIGYINEDEEKGVSGLELMYQDKLEADDTCLSIWADAAGNIIKGISPAIDYGVGYSGYMEEHALITTIDRRLQYVCERALDEAGDSGAVVVMECTTGDVLAWASSPTFNPNSIESYLKDKGNCLVDKVCQGSYAPGSVFKIITAAAALEEKVCDEKQIFECKGEVTIEGVTVKCSTGGDDGHGSLDMADAMAYSCNCYFAQLGEEVGCDKIIDMARTMGLGENVFINLPQESKGNIPDKEVVSKADTTNISIGQGQLLVTPLQMAKVTAIIAAGGRNVEPRLVLVDNNRKYSQLISEETAQKIDKMLNCVMDYGTGKGNWQIPVRGKTGTAEATLYGENINNCWFTGYFYKDEKSYVVTVLVERGFSGSATALPAFKSVAEFLLNNF